MHDLKEYFVTLREIKKIQRQEETDGSVEDNKKTPVTGCDLSFLLVTKTSKHRVCLRNECKP